MTMGMISCPVSPARDNFVRSKTVYSLASQFLLHD
jgi:hypothetical protein